MSFAASALRTIAFFTVLNGTGHLVLGNTDAALYIDGKIRTDGVDFQGTSVLVERNGVTVQFLTKDIARLHLRLDLQRIYVLTFEHAGCLTKKLRFDTHVPAAAVGRAPFSFPFKVTLEKTEEGAKLEYAQPVGHIRYFHDKSDFSYDTNFTLKHLEGEEVEEEVSADAIAPMELAPELSSPNPTSGPSTLQIVSVAPMVEAVPISVMKEPPPPVEEVEVSEVLPAPAVPAPKTIPLAPEERKTELTTTLPMTKAEASTAVTAPVVSAKAAQHMPRTTTTRTVVRQPLPEPVVLPDGRTEELLVDKGHVTTIVRITEAGHTREYRRVAHHHGAVYYFFNGTSCGEATYRSGILEH